MSPSSSSNNHVRYILLAEFDIDRGSSLAHQYPEPTGADENFLAEQMLPDGAHLREEDWTVFFLNRKQKCTPGEGKRNRDSVAMAEQPLLYVLNLVRTKHDSQARRGAVVKAMAICATFPAVDIFKVSCNHPLTVIILIIDCLQAILLLAMEKYFLAPSVEVLELLFRTVNSLDLSDMPQFSLPEKRILRAWDIPDLFEEKFVAASAGRRTRDEAADGSTATSTAAAPAALDQIDEGAEAKRNTTYIDLAAGKSTTATTTTDTGIGVTGVRKDRYFFETTITYDSINIPIRVPLTNYTEEVGDFSLIKLISTFSPSSPSHTLSPPFHAHLTTAGAHTHPIIVLMNALLTQKRILFLGHERPAGEVANYVLAACAMGSGGGGVLRGFTDRAFPYANLAHLDDLLNW
ncbi:docking domain of Afi1 for Arf3 in vesicle trafficking-domain-containing protein [Syncephalis pseudoplumigaleata]|uniref:Docking domain of Afi1 for Arf3 in vesicle trafficking-domain-containing protein n=1 Tax=Syncephalis pseudoplumigaleata TaxID=1712513 RepID=A0A4P9Z6U9_9FUNG|nr:docking domain of Afi1 for Arf3 in vesicle trafficking-domain-containing protein [Syncephalis pseudoplumigaleata]|eukprot:RKP27902.1 docking domain of Afi1 for Arf3 in vesicle trafficking-domain-containing protein [Syncephalis pseudoplumigaleata]